MRNELKPCPLCKSAAGVGRSDDGYWNVECSMPSCNLTLQPRVRFTRDEVIEQWNARAAYDTDDRIKELTDAGNALTETIKFTKASLVAGLTKRELSILMDDLDKWNRTALAAYDTDDRITKHGSYFQAMKAADDRIKELCEALTKCRDKFEEYVVLHKAKLPSDYAKAPANWREIAEKINRNQAMADLCSTALKGNA